MTPDNLHPEQKPDQGKPNPEESTFIGSSPFNIEMIDRARDLLASPPEQIGPYRILERIGGGGMGEVFRAEQREPIRRQVAIKIIKLGMDTKAVIARFEAERQALALMDHPHIAKVFDAAAEETGRPYFVMEYVKGKPITDYADQNHLTIPERLELFEQVCQAIQHAHHKGIIHRDMKPSNVLVSTHDGKPFAKVIDFGIAKAVAQQLTDKTLFTQHDQFIGTPQYMSPEQAEGSLDIDTRTDVYSLGVLLYELLTGSTPFSSAELRAAAFEQIKKLIVEVDPPKPSTRLSQSEQTLPTLAAFRRTEPKRLGNLVTGELDWIVMKALEKDRKRRYDTPAVFAQDILAHLHGEPVLAAPPSSFYQLRKFMRKHRGPVIGAAAVGGSLAVGIIGTSWGYYRANQYAHQEHQARLEASQAKEAATAARDAEAKQREAAEFLAYVSNLKSAQFAIENEAWPLARERLAACPEHLRGWEWKYLSQQANSVLMSLPQACTGARFSPDGRFIITRIENNNFLPPYFESLWTLEGQPFGRLHLGEETVGFRSIQFSAKSDEILTVDDQGNIHLWSLDKQKPVLRTKLPITWNWTSTDQQVILSPAGNRVLTISANKDVVQLWTNEGKAINDSIPISHPYIAEFSPDGSSMLVTENSLAIQIWTTEGQRQGKQLVNSAPVTRAIYSYSGKHLIAETKSESSLGEKNVQVWSLDGNPVGQAKPRVVFGFADDTLNREMVISRGDRGITFSTEDGHQQGDIIISGNSWLEEFTGGLNCSGGHIYELDRDGLPLFILSEKGKLFDSMSNSNPETSAGTRTSPILATGKVSASLWDSGNGCLGKVCIPLMNNMYGVAVSCLSEDKNKLLVCAYEWASENTVQPRVINTSNVICPYEEFPEEDAFLRIEALINEDIVVTSPSSVEPIPNSNWTVKIDSDHRLHTVSRDNNRPKQRTLLENASVFVIAPDGSRLVAASRNHLHFFETENWRELAVFREASPVKSIRFTPSGGRLILELEAAGASPAKIKTYDVLTLQQQRRAFTLRQQELVAAIKLTDSLWNSTTPTEELANTITSNPQISPFQKFYGVREVKDRIEYLTKEARDKFDDLISLALIDESKFLSQITDPAVEPAKQRLNTEIHKLFKNWEPDADDWDLAAYSIANEPNRTAEDYQKAVKLAQQALDSDPEYWSYLESAGLASYRVGDYSRALSLLQKAEARAPEEEKWYPRLYAAVAMTQFRLGETSKARETLQRNNYDELEVGKTDWRRGDIKLFREAQALINPPPTEQPK